MGGSAGGRFFFRVPLSSAAAIVVVSTGNAGPTVIRGAAPFKPFDFNPPEVLGPGGWYFFTPQEARTVEALVARLIPADDLSVSGQDAGCAVFIDRQLAGSYGTSERLYMQGPFQQGTPQQGDQSELVPRERYRIGIAALDEYCRTTYQKSFAELSPADQDGASAFPQNPGYNPTGTVGALAFKAANRPTLAN